MDRHRQKLYLSVIIDAADSITQYVTGLERSSFLEDELRQSAVTQKLNVIGTAAARLPRIFWKQHNLRFWRDLAKFRYIGLHEYFSSVDGSMLWRTATKRIPSIRTTVAQILESEFSV